MILTYHQNTLRVLALCVGMVCAAASGADAPESRETDSTVEAARQALRPVSEAVVPPRLQSSVETAGQHPLAKVILKTRAGEFGPQPQWRLSLMLQGLQVEPRLAKLTAYSSRCPDGGGTATRWGSRVRPGICAADPRYWGPGSVIWVCDPVAQLLIVEDTGRAVKGRDRFDICFGDDAAACRRFGVQRLPYVPLLVEAPLRRWGTKPHDWQPPVPEGRQSCLPPFM